MTETAPRTRKPKPSPVFACRKVIDRGRQGRIEISGKRYDYAQEPLPPLCEVLACVKLVKRTVDRGDDLSSGPVVYHISQLPQWFECDCWDFLERQADKGGHCKHIRACVELGLFDDVPESVDWLLNYVPQTTANNGSIPF